MPDAPPEATDAPPTFHFFMEGIGKIAVNDPTISGAGIKVATRTPANFAVYVRESPGLEGRPLRDAEAIDLRTTTFYIFAVSPATMGG